MTSSSKQPTKAARQSFSAPTSTNKKQFVNREKIGGPIPRTPTRRRKKKKRDASKPVAPHFNFPNHSSSRKNLKEKFIFQINERLSFH